MAWMDGFIKICRDERIVLLAIGVATFGLVSSMVTGLIWIRDSNAMPPAEPEKHYITQDTEDALKEETLLKLLNHPNESVRDIASQIVLERALHDEETITCLLYGITRPDYDMRMQCISCLSLLTAPSQNLDRLSMLNPQQAYEALVKFLELNLLDVAPPDLGDKYWDEWDLRDVSERQCLCFIFLLINRHGADVLIKAKFVEKWLAKQEWGEDPEQRRRSFQHYMERRRNRLVSILDSIFLSRYGPRALEKAGLIIQDEAGGYPYLLQRVGLPESNFGSPVEGMVEQPRRAGEHSAEERRLRQRHREAMVLGDGTRPLGRDDIFERAQNSPT